MKANGAALAAMVWTEEKCGIVAWLKVQGFFLTGTVVKES